LEADLIIVGRKDRSGLEELLLGSVSSDVVHHAPCAVLVTQT
jgi:nucleotide-binding universal stress UspA family protein